MRLLYSSFAVGLALMALACPKPPDAPADDAGTETAPDASASPTGPAPVSFSLQYQLPDAGMDVIALVGEEEGRPLIDSTSMLELRSSQGLRNYRVRLFDESERALISDDAAEESPGGLLYRISLPTPLKAGHKYTLVVDAQTGTSLLDAQGREVADLRAAFQISGEKEKLPPPTKKKRRR